MSRLACLGGTPVAADLLGGVTLKTRADLERKYLLQAFDSGVWDNWPGKNSMAEIFEREWAEFCTSPFCAMVTNGTHSLQVALETLDIGAGDEVIVPGLTWQATASAVCDVNAVPVLVDVDPTTLCIDASKIEAAITPRTRAIMPVHLYHRMADMDKIGSIARKHKLFVIEDTAHAHGSQWDGRGAGSLGNFGSFSFQSTKLVQSAEGGALLMKKEDHYWKVLSQRCCGREMKPGIKLHSGNYRITAFQGAILRGQLAAFRKNADIIDRNGLALDKAVEAAPGVRPLRRSKHLTRECGYGFVFLYDGKAFDGLECSRFREALTAELGFEFGTTYTPLSHSELYFPQTKRRHQLSSQYVKAITPSRWQLPVADEIWRNQAVLAHWKILACPPKRARLHTDAIVKIYENRHELLSRKSR